MVNRILLARHVSKSEPGVVHRVTMDREGNVFCTCKGFTFHRYCWHSDAHLEPEEQAAARKARKGAYVLREHATA